MRMSIFKLIIILLTLGIFFNSEIFPYNYLLFISYFEESRASCFNMDYDGNITLKQDFEVGWDAQYVAASPNGHMVIISADSYEPKLTYIYVNKEREITSIIHGSAKSPRPVVFSIDKPLVYIGSNPSCIYKINYNECKIEVSEKRNFEKMFLTEIRFFRSLTFLSSFDDRRGIARSV